MRHGELAAGAMGDSDTLSGELAHAIRVHFGCLPEHEVLEAIRKLRDANALYGIALGESAQPEEERP